MELLKLRQEMMTRHYDLVRITDPLEMFYLVGIQPSSATLVVAKDRLYLLTDYRYKDEAKSLLDENAIVVDVQKLNSPIEFFLGIQEDYPHGTIAYNGSSLEAYISGLKWVQDGTLLKELREVKSASEIANLQKACEITDAAFGHICQWIKPGMSEREVALEIEYFMKRKGADLSMAYDIVVASGIRSSFAHGRASSKIIESTDVVLFDFGCRYNGYCSDLSRTIFMGTPTEKQKDAYEALLKAQELAIKNVTVGTQSASLDELCRTTLTQDGFGEVYGTGLGHGVGLTVAEEPFLVDLPTYFKSVPLKVGHVLTVEPAVYFSGEFGIRIEDIIWLSEKGPINLVKAPKDIIALRNA